MGHQIIPYITEAEIKERVRTLGRQIAEDYSGTDVLLIAILNGSTIFLADLIRATDLNLTVDFMAVSPFEEGGGVRILKDLSVDIAEKNVLIVEDLLDTGNTLTTVVDILRSRGVNSLKICSLLDKSAHRTTNVPVEYVGFVIPDRYVVGYGMDYEEQYRNLPYIGFIEYTED